HRAMVGPAERHGEFIARLAAERARLQIAQVMRVGWLAIADQAWLVGDRAKVLSIAITPGCRNSEDALVDTLRCPCVSTLGGDGFLRPNSLGFREISVRRFIRGRKLPEPPFN